MVSAGSRAARLQSQGSSLNVFWAASPPQTASVLSDIRDMAARLNPSRVFYIRPAGRHAARARGRARSLAGGLRANALSAHSAEDKRFELLRGCLHHAFQVCGRSR